MNPGVCPICRATYRSCEFTTDGLGRLVLDWHVCTPVRYRVEEEAVVRELEALVIPPRRPPSPRPACRVCSRFLGRNDRNTCRRCKRQIYLRAAHRPKNEAAA